MINFLTFCWSFLLIIVILYVLIVIFFFNLSYINYKGYNLHSSSLKIVKWLQLGKFLSYLKIKYNQRSFKYFVKFQKYKLIFNKSANFQIFKEFKLNFNREFKEFYRGLKLLGLKLYLYFNHIEIEFIIDPFTAKITKFNYEHIDFFNIYNLNLNDLLRVTYFTLMDNPMISNKLNVNKGSISIIGISHTDPETDISRKFILHTN